MASRKEVAFKDHDRFLRFVRLYFQRQGVIAALQAIQTQMAQQLQAVEGELTAVARHEGIPLDTPLDLDAERGCVAWSEPDP